MSNMDTADTLLEAFNTQSWDVTRKHASANLKYNEMATGRKTDTVDAWIENSKGWRGAFSNAHGKVISRVESGNQVIEEVVWTGTHDGNLMSPDGTVIPPTHKSMTTPACMVNTFEDGKLVAVNHYFDMMSMMAQLGLLPE